MASRFDKLCKALNHFWNPDKQAKQLYQEIGEQRMIIKKLGTEVNSLKVWVDKYAHTLSYFTEAINAMVWQKNHEHRYILANERHCKVLFGLTNSPECLDRIEGRTDAELIKMVFLENGIENTFGEMCFITDTYTEQLGQACHYFEAGAINGEQKLLYVAKTPMHDSKGKFTGTVSAGWDITEHSLFIIHQLNRWIFSKKVERLFHSKRGFAYYIRPVLKQCDIFESICKQAMDSKDGFCRHCSIEGNTCQQNQKLREKLNDLQTNSNNPKSRQS